MRHLLALLALFSATAIATEVRLHEVDSKSWTGDRVHHFRLEITNQVNDLLECAAFAAKRLLSDQLLVFIGGDRTVESQCFLANRSRCLRLPRGGLVTPENENSTKVFVISLETCWTTIQHRVDNTIDFYRNWSDYAVGFGQEPSRNFWIGLQTLHWLTLSAVRTLRVRMKKWDDTEHWAQYDSFSVASETLNFRLSLSGFTSSSYLVGDSMAHHNGHPFSTFDSDNDNYNANCAVLYKGAWWYNSCHHVNGNGLYYNPPEASNVPVSATGISWRYPFGYEYSMKEFEMLIC